MRIAIDRIRADGGTQPRSTIDFTVVEDYAQAMGGGATLPPATVFYDGTDYWLADGFHRREAHKLLGLAEIECDVRQGTHRDAVLFSVGANAVHGLRRTNEDKRRAVRKLLDDEEWGRWSDNEVARRCGVSQPFVSKLRPKPAHTNNGSKSRTFVHSKTGKPTLMRTEKIGKGSSKSSVAETADTQTPEVHPPAEIVPPKPGRDSSHDYLFDAVRTIREQMARLPGPEEAAANYPKDFWHGLTAEDAEAVAQWWAEFARIWRAGKPARDAHKQRLMTAAKEISNAAE